MTDEHSKEAEEAWEGLATALADESRRIRSAARDWLRVATQVYGGTLGGLGGGYIPLNPYAYNGVAGQVHSPNVFEQMRQQAVFDPYQSAMISGLGHLPSSGVFGGGR